VIELTPEYKRELNRRIQAAIARNEEAARLRRAEAQQKRAREILGRRRASNLARLRRELATPDASELRRLRLRRGLSLRALAAEVGVSRTTIWRLELAPDRTHTPRATWDRIALALRCDVDAIRPRLRPRR
jgi:DNA-binding XRE family transcriptional regulator